jgi:hypothetical protein
VPGRGESHQKGDAQDEIGGRGRPQARGSSVLMMASS